MSRACFKEGRKRRNKSCKGNIRLMGKRRRGNEVGRFYREIDRGERV